MATIPDKFLGTYVSKDGQHDIHVLADKVTVGKKLQSTGNVSTWIPVGTAATKGTAVLSFAKTSSLSAYTLQVVFDSTKGQALLQASTALDKQESGIAWPQASGDKGEIAMFKSEEKKDHTYLYALGALLIVFVVMEKKGGMHKLF
jgi:hypothetical protein